MGSNITPYTIKMPNDLLTSPAYNAPNTVTDYEAKQVFRRFIDMDRFQGYRVSELLLILSGIFSESEHL